MNIDRLLEEQSRHNNRLRELSTGRATSDTAGELQHTDMKLRYCNAALAEARMSSRQRESR